MGHAYILKSKGQPYVHFETLPSFYGSLTNVEFLRLGHFLRNYKGRSHEIWVMHTSRRFKVNPRFNFESGPTFYSSLTNVEFLRLGHFLRNYKG